jgi:hypothetical protein
MRHCAARSFFNTTLRVRVIAHRFDFPMYGIPAFFGYGIISILGMHHIKLRT